MIQLAALEVEVEVAAEAAVAPPLYLVDLPWLSERTRLLAEDLARAQQNNRKAKNCDVS